MNNKKIKYIILFMLINFMVIKPIWSFTISPINENIKNQILVKKTWSKGCPVPIERLRLISFPYYNFEGKQQQGELVVLDAVANHVLDIVKNLYNIKFPMETVNRIETYNLKPEEENFEGLPKEHNNTSGFNCRAIKDTNIFSIHSYGLAIDINPKQNPYVIIESPNSNKIKNIKTQESHTVYVQPFMGAYYLNRTNKRAGMIIKDDAIIDLFYNNGFVIWGGDWNYPIDYQHFQTTRELANLLALMEPEDAKYFFDLYVQSKLLKNTNTSSKNIIIKITQNYIKNPKLVMSFIKDNESKFINEPQSILNYLN